VKLRDARLTLLVNEDQINIEVEDCAASTVFLRLKLTPEQFTRALSRQAFVKCDSGEVFHLDRVGKKQEHKTLEFPLPKDLGYGKRKEAASAAVLERCPEGWIPDNYFSSQNSFFDKDGEPWARCTIRRYVELGED